MKAGSIVGFCGKCKKQFREDIIKCPDCGKYCVNWSIDRETEITAINRWKIQNGIS